MRLIQSKGGYIGGGMMLLNDQAGSSGITLNKAAFHLSSFIPAGEDHSFGIGLTGSMDQRTYNFNSATWDSQFNGMSYDPSLASGESEVSEKKTVFDAGIGFLWKYKPSGGNFQKRELVNFTFGFSVLHVNTPNIAFYGKDRQHTRYNAHFNLTIPFGMVFIQPLACYSQSGSFK